MIASELISKTLIPLKTSDTGAEALDVMNDYYVKHLPVVNNKQLLGVLSEEDIINHDVNEAVGSYALTLPLSVKVTEDDHLFEVLGVMSDYNLTVVPVVDDEDDFIGLITQEDLIHYYASSFSFSEPGSILVIELSKRDYSLAEISRIIENENTAVLSVFLSMQADNPNILVTIKVNRQDIQHVKAALERYGYEIKASFQEADYVDTLKERYEMLMNYLNV